MLCCQELPSGEWLQFIGQIFQPIATSLPFDALNPLELLCSHWALAILPAQSGTPATPNQPSSLTQKCKFLTLLQPTPLPPTPYPVNPQAQHLSTLLTSRKV